MALSVLYIFLAAGAGQQPILLTVHPKDSASKRAAQFMSLGFRDAANKSDKFTPSPQAALYGDREINTKKLYSDAEALAQAAQQDYDNLDTEKAQQKFEQALAIFENNSGELDTMKPAAKFALLAAAVALLNNNEKVARTYMQRALLYDPNVQADPRVYNSTAMAVFKDVRQKLSRGQKGSLSISTNPAYAEYYVDGDFYGMTPDKIDRLDAGPHLVRVVRDGFRSTSEVVDVKAGRGETTATLNMVAMPQQQTVVNMLDKATADMKSPTNPAAAALAAKGGVNYVLVVSVSVNGDQVKVTGAIYHASNSRLAYAERSFSASAEQYREEAAALWDGLVKEVGKLPMGALAASGDTGTTTIRSKPKLKWIVTGTLLGVGGGLVILGTAFGIKALVDQPNFKNMVQNNQPAVNNAQSALKTSALIADIGIIAGSVVAAAGVACLVFWDDRPKGQKIVDNLHLDFGATRDGAYLGAYGSF